MKLTDIVSEAILATGLAFSLTNPLYSTETKPTQSPQVSQPLQQYTFSNFTKALGKRYEVLSEKDKEKVKEYWENSADLKKTLIPRDQVIEAYASPQKLQDYIYKRLSKEDKEEFEEFMKNFKGIKEKDLSYYIPGIATRKRILSSIKNNYQKEFPWYVNIENPDYSEKLIIWMHRRASNQK